MPSPPEGEAALRGLARRFSEVEAAVLGRLEQAAVGDRRSLLRQALELLVGLRRMDLRRPVELAYLHEHPKGATRAVADLAGGLALRLDGGARVASESARALYAEVSPATVSELTAEPLVANVDSRGRRWGLGAWAEMNATTYGRHASSRGVADSVGRGGLVTVEVGECPICQEFAGETKVGSGALPPYHPSCTCVAVPA